MNKFNINIKKLFPGIISLCIVAGMAFSTLATNIDLEAFVEKEDYLSKYYELDYKIDDIDNELERLYKFVCTNVRTYNGGYYNNNYGGRSPFYFANTNVDYHWGMRPIADLSEEKYLRFAVGGVINAFGNHGKTDVWEYEVPATLCSWRPGIELAPNSKVSVIARRTWANSTSYSSHVSNSQIEIIMGPFKKFPKITAGGSAKTNGLIGCMPLFLKTSLSLSSIYYAYGTTEKPTSWSSTTQTNEVNTAWKGSNTSFSDPVDYTEFTTDPYRKNNSIYENNFYFTGTSTTADFSNLENLWFRLYYSYNGNSGIVSAAILDNYVLTSWNHNN